MPFPSPTAPVKLRQQQNVPLFMFLRIAIVAKVIQSMLSRKKLLVVDGWIVSEGVIRKMWNKELEEITDRRGYGGGRPSRSPKIKRMILDNPQSSISKIQHLVKEERGKSVGRGTISRTFHQAGLKSLCFSFVGSPRYCLTIARIAFHLLTSGRERLWSSGRDVSSLTKRCGSYTLVVSLDKTPVCVLPVQPKFSQSKRTNVPERFMYGVICQSMVCLILFFWTAP